MAQPVNLANPPELIRTLRAREMIATAILCQMNLALGAPPDVGMKETIQLVKVVVT